MQIVQKILFFILCISFLMNGALPFLLQWTVSQMQTEAEERLEKNHLQTIYIARANLHWTKAGKEICIDNKLFDVKEYHVNGDELIVKGLFDEEETALAQQLNQLQNQQKAKEGILLIKYFQLLNQTFFQSDSCFMAIHFNRTSIYPEVVTTSPKSIFLKIPSPPPQV